MRMNISFDIDGTMNILDEVILDLAVHYMQIQKVPINYVRKDKYSISEALGVSEDISNEFIDSIDYSKIPLRKDFVEVYNNRFKDNSRYNVHIITARNPNAKLMFIDSNNNIVYRTIKELTIEQLRREGVKYSTISFTHNKSAVMLREDIKVHVDDCVTVIEDLRSKDLKVIPVKTRYINHIQDHYSNWHDIANEIDSFYDNGNWK